MLRIYDCAMERDGISVTAEGGLLMEMESITCFQYRLRNLACDGEILKLLKALHERCGGQWVYSVHQNYEVYPDTPELSEAFFYPEWWKRGPVKAAFPGIQ